MVEGMLTSNNLPSVKKCVKTHYCDMQSCQSEMAVSVLKKDYQCMKGKKNTYFNRMMQNMHKLSGWTLFQTRQFCTNQ